MSKTKPVSTGIIRHSPRLVNASPRTAHLTRLPRHPFVATVAVIGCYLFGIPVLLTPDSARTASPNHLIRSTHRAANLSGYSLTRHAILVFDENVNLLFFR
jgi:hypothetical protein